MVINNVYILSIIGGYVIIDLQTVFTVEEVTVNPWGFSVERIFFRSNNPPWLFFTLSVPKKAYSLRKINNRAVFKGGCMPFRKKSIPHRLKTNPKLIVMMWTPSTNIWLFPIGKESRERLVTLFTLLNKKTKNGYAPRPRINYFERKVYPALAARHGYLLSYHRVPPLSVFLKYARNSDWEQLIPERYLDPGAFVPNESGSETDEPVKPGPKTKAWKDPKFKRGFVGKMSDYFSGE